MNQTFTRTQTLRQRLPHLFWRISSDLLVQQFKHKQGGHRRHRTPTLYHLFLYIAMTLIAVRGLAAGLALYNDWLIYFEYDLVLWTMYRCGALDTISSLLSTPVSLSAIFLDYLVQFHLDSRILALAYELVITNQHNFFKNNPNLKLTIASFQFRHPLVSLKQLSTDLKTFYQPKDQIIFTTKLNYFTSLSTKQRYTLLMINYAFECISLIFLTAVTVLLASIMVWHNYFLIVFDYSAIQSTLALLDLLIFSYIVCRMGRNCLYLGHIFCIISFGLTMKLNRLKSILKHSLVATNCGKLASKRLATRLGYYQTQHWSIIKVCMILNSNMVSPLFYIGTLCNIALNVYYVTLLCFSRSDIEEKLWMCLVPGLQAFIWLLGATAILLLQKQLFCGISEMLFPLQGALTGKSALIFISKLKLATHYEIIHSVGQFHFSVGSIGQISRRSFFEFFIAYSAYLMFAFSMAPHLAIK